MPAPSHPSPLVILLESMARFPARAIRRAGRGAAQRRGVTGDADAVGHHEATSPWPQEARVCFLEDLPVPGALAGSSGRRPAPASGVLRSLPASARRSLASGERMPPRQLPGSVRPPAARGGPWQNGTRAVDLPDQPAPTRPPVRAPVPATLGVGSKRPVTAGDARIMRPAHWCGDTRAALLRSPRAAIFPDKVNRSLSADVIPEWRAAPYPGPRATSRHLISVIPAQAGTRHLAPR